MPDESDQPLSEAYGEALHTYLTAGGEAPLLQAYELGRRATREGLGILDVIGMHQLVLNNLAVELSRRRGWLMRANEFLAEAASPYEMTLRAYRDAAQMLGVTAGRATEYAEIVRAREQLSAILDATTAHIYLKDAEGRYMFANQPCLTAFGCSAEELIGKRDQEALSPSVATILSEHDRRTLSHREPWEIEETLELARGRRTFLALKFPLIDTHGHTYGVCCVATDITERKRADDALRRAKDALEMANRELESFNYTVAHDLRAPARRIDGFVEALLEEEQGLSPDAARYAANIKRSAGTMMELIDGLMVLSKVSRSQVRRSPVDLAAVARECLAMLQQAEPGRLVAASMPDSVKVSGDPALLRAVLDNLLGNAWKFTATRERAEIALAVEGDPQAPIYCVRDNGVGFDMEHASRLFVPFQRLHREKDFQGTGVGLATVQRIVELHGGRIWAEAAVDKGAAFRFTLGPGG